jgi:hypothetical protein
VNVINVKNCHAENRKNLQNIVSSPEIERILKKWRGSTEAVISNLKRGFELQRVLWKGFEKFFSKVAWSFLGYNLRLMVNRMQESVFFVSDKNT